MVWWMGAVSGASEVDVRADWSDLLCGAGCSLDLGRRSVFIFLSASAWKGLPGRREEGAARPTALDDSTRRRELNKKGWMELRRASRHLKQVCLTGRGGIPIFVFCPPLP
jgi:hypothetical protein